MTNPNGVSNCKSFDEHVIHILSWILLIKNRFSDLFLKFLDVDCISLSSFDIVKKIYQFGGIILEIFENFVIFMKGK